MSASARPRKSKVRPDAVARRLGALTEGLVVEKVLKADARELVIEFADGTRLFVRADSRLNISVTGVSDAAQRGFKAP